MGHSGIGVDEGTFESWRMDPQHGGRKGHSRPRQQHLQSLGSASNEWWREVGESLAVQGVGSEQIVWILSDKLWGCGGQVVNG